MLDTRTGRTCCDRCASTSCAVRAARRRLLKAAVFRADESHADDGFPELGRLPRTIMGRVLDVSPHILAISSGATQTRLTLTADAVAWRGGPVDPAALFPGDLAVVRLHPTCRGVADRIWANIGRVAGTIMERHKNTLLVDVGVSGKREVVVVPPRAASRIQVRFPNLEPGYLVDVIGLRQADGLAALVPATSQPAYRVSNLPVPPLVSGHVPDAISGSATWHESSGEPFGLLGVSYPALDPDAGCAEEPAGGPPPAFVRMPYLSVGSLLRIRNDCTGATCVLPVTGCAPVVRLFNDRCLDCGTSPRGRIADLSLASFVALGGELERGCFNATIATGR
jgi:hypothetical protein